jgi:hypothetical protein
VGGNRSFQPGVPRGKQSTNRGPYQNDNYENDARQRNYSRPDSHLYEPYDEDGENGPQYLKRKDQRRLAQISFSFDFFFFHIFNV